MTHRTHIRETMNKDAKYIYLARNPWDICISLFCMTTDLSCFQLEDGTLQEFFEPFIEGDLGYGSYFDHVASAYAIKDEPNFFFVTYEELKKDMKGAVLRLASFLGETYERALLQNSQMLQNILEWSEPEHMRKVILVNFSGNTVTSKEGYGGDRAKYALVKKAKVGGWKEYFTPGLLARFEQKNRKKGTRHLFWRCGQTFEMKPSRYHAGLRSTKYFPYLSP
ncbi:hypothetical protein HPB49_021919 [Dermacentor silvarum]|uniref:Uncharacterized protein n=1 Tax=Dermacentor silvarum TaxID=543639 RepID=A0ACB8D8H2_DERSI|nr:hypothetical protein HPB49_021919 [Dermacentor silvarum]